MLAWHEEKKVYTEFVKATEEMLYEVENVYKCCYFIVPHWSIESNYGEELDQYNYEFGFFNSEDDKWEFYVTEQNNSYEAFEKFLDEFWMEYERRVKKYTED